MLVLSRQRDETIMIGDQVEITIVDIRGDKVRLGITAPPQVAVHRKEVYEAIKAENRRAAQAQGAELNGLAMGVRPGRRAGVPAAGRVSTATGQKPAPADDARPRKNVSDTDGRRQATR